MDWKFLFFTADGRINRQNFWIGVLILFAVSIVLGWIPLIGWLISLATIYCSVCLYSKRLHDIGKSGWLQLIPFGVAAVLMIVGFAVGGTAMMAGFAMHPDGADMNPAAFAGMGMMAGFMGLAGLVGLIFLLWVGLTPGEAGENRYGAPQVATTPAPAA